jgi:hypothetical protein
MHPLSLAKRRAARRRHEDGAAMFIVAMTLAVLASVGVYALAAASNEVRTSGNERQNTQTHYLSQYGILVASEELAATRAQLYLGVMMATPDAKCTGVPQPGGSIPLDPMITACRRMGANEFHDSAGNWLAPPTVGYTGTVPFAGSSAGSVPPGSLGPIPVKADFYVELSAPTSTRNASGYGLNMQSCFLQFTATSFGLTQPQYLSGGSNPASATFFGGEGIEMERARLVAGPITPCPM